MRYLIVLVLLAAMPALGQPAKTTRDAATGQYTTTEAAKANPSTTVTETTTKSVVKKKQKRGCPK